MLRLRALVVLTLFCAFSAAITAQVPATGIYPFGSFDNKGPETINLGNLNFNVSVPVLQKAGRGMGFYYGLSYDSSVWMRSTANGVPVWMPVSLFGWKGDTNALVGFITYSTDTQTFPDPQGPLPPHGGQPATCTVATYNNWTYYDTFGTTHPFNGTTSKVTKGIADDCDQGNHQFTETASDGSGFTINVTLNTHAFMNNVRGQKIVPSVLTQGAGTVTDSNGNQLSVDQSGHFTDTTGAVVLSIAGAAPNPRTFTYTDTSGQPRAVTISYASYTVQTAFGCSGVGEYGPTANSLVDRVTFADGSYYAFTYEPTPGNPANVTGRLASMRLPAGGVINYSYSGGSNGIVCADGSTAGLTRTLASSGNSPASTWSYSRTQGTGTSHTDITDGLNNHLAYDFVSASNQPTGTVAAYYETNRTAYQGAASGTPVLNRKTCYNEGNFACTTPSLTLPITQVDTFETVDGQQQRGTSSGYNAYGLLTSKGYYDFGGPGQRGSLLTSESLTYQINGNAPQLIGDRTSDGSGHLLSETTYRYDENTPTQTSGLPQHTSVSDPRSNLTTMQKNAGGNQAYSSVFHYTYDDAGQMLTGTDPATGATLTYAYDSATDTRPISVTYPTVNGVTLSTSATYEPNTGLLQTSTDFNHNVTQYGYDSMLRQTSVSYPDGGGTTMTYNIAGSPATITQSVRQTASVNITSMMTLDGYGRAQQSTLYDPSGDDLTQYGYDGNGNPFYSTNPYRSTSDTTYGSTTNSYDVLGRLTSSLLPDGNTNTTTYLANTEVIKDGAGHQRKLLRDGIGRIAQVLEPDSSGAFTYSTLYSYLQSYSSTGTYQTIIQQQGGTTDSSQWRTRTFTYNMFGQLTQETAPESGTTSYTYSCTSSYQVLCSRTDARGITTTYNHDALNRVANIAYSDGTPANYYTYDVAPGWMSDAQNVAGRLANSSNQYGGGTSGRATATTYSYDAMGRIIRTWEQTPLTSPGGFFVYSKYDLAGNLTDLTYPDGRHVTQSWDGVGRLNNVIYADWNGQGVNYSYWSSPVYYPNGSLRSVALGNGATATFNMNSRFQPSEIKFQTNLNGTQTIFDKQYSYTSSCQSSNNGNVVQIVDPLNNANSQGFCYDNLNRLASFSNGGASMQQTYLYDSFGNMNQTGPGTLQSNLSFGSNNQVNSSGYGYDQAGNLLLSNNGAGTSTSFAYDAESRLSNVNNGAANYIYNESGQRVRKNVGGDWTEYLFFGGQPIAELHPDGTWSDYIYANGQRVARADSFDGRLHLSGVNCDYSQCSVHNSGVYLPYGSGYVVQNGDVLHLRQYQAGSVQGGLMIGFTDGSITNWSTPDTDGQQLNSDGYKNAWHYRTVNMSAHTGKTISSIILLDEVGSTGGPFDLYATDISITSTNGSVLSIYNRQQGLSLPTALVNGVTNLNGYSEASNSAADSATPQYTTTYYVGDQIGSARMLLAGIDWPVSSSTFYPFGQEAQSSTDPNHYRFATLERDGESGLDHATFRQYSSAQGRWMSPDSYKGSYDFSNPQSFNRYNYVLNNPLIYIDPSGQNIFNEIFDLIFDLFGGGFGGWGGGSDGGGGGPSAPPFIPWPSSGTPSPVRAGGSGGSGSGKNGSSNTTAPSKTSLVKSIACGAFSGLVNAANPQNLNSTIGIGAGGSAGVGFILGVAASAGVQIAADSSGNLGVAFNVGGNPGYGVFGVGATGGGQVSYSTASNIYGLSGFSAGGGVTAGPGGVDLALSSSGVTATGTLGAGIGTKGAALSLNYTWVPQALSTNCRH